MERLSAREGRVLASLVEKQLTIPQHYPLTLNTLVAACNQTSSRDPVTAYGEAEVLGAVESLKARRMVRAVLPSHGRSVVRYRHVLDEAFGLDAPQLAVLAVLELRGPQTVAELRTRTERMATIDSVDHELGLLASREEPLVELVGRGPGQKEDRWTSLLAEPGRRPGSSGTAGTTGADGEAGSAADASPPWRGESGFETTDPQREDLRCEIDALRADVEELRATVESIRSGLEDLRTGLGG